MEGQVNRAILLWENWHEKQNMLESVFGSGIAFELDKEKFQFLSAGVARITSGASTDEKLVLAMLKKTTARLEKQLFPSPVVRVLRRLKSLVYDRPVQAARSKKLKSENVLSLSRDLSSIGVNPEKLNLDKRLNFESPRMDIAIVSPYGTDHNFDVKLHMEKNHSGAYQLNGYTAMLKDPVNPGKSKAYTFDVNLGINVREAANLLQGRAVLKYQPVGENRMASKWMQLDFKKPTPEGNPQLKEMWVNHGFNIRQELTKIATALEKWELTSAKVLDGLEKGNQVALKQLGGETCYLEANPLNKEIIILNDKKQPITLERLKKQEEAVLRPKPAQTKTHIKKLQLNKKQQQDQSLSVS